MRLLKYVLIDHLAVLYSFNFASHLIAKPAKKLTYDYLSIHLNDNFYINEIQN